MLPIYTVLHNAQTILRPVLKLKRHFMLSLHHGIRNTTVVTLAHHIQPTRPRVVVFGVVLSCAQTGLAYRGTGRFATAATAE